MGISLVAIIASIVLIFTKGLNYGIDFTGGAEVQLKFQKAYTTADLRDTLDKAGFKNLVIQQLGLASDNQYLVKFRPDESELQQIGNRVEKALGEKMARNEFEIQRTDVVGPQAGGELRKSGFLSMFYTLLCILIYVAIRFDYRYGPGAVIALFHDSIITLGIFVLLQKEFSLQILAAILTLIGYSNNDTIIVYDRIRETMRLYPNRGLEENINRSINETLSRTLLTSLFTLFVVMALMVLGGGVISEFAFTLLIGIVVGTYSSVFIASPILIFLTHIQQKKAAKQAGGVGMLGNKPAT